MMQIYSILIQDSYVVYRCMAVSYFKRCEWLLWQGCSGIGWLHEQNNACLSCISAVVMIAIF